MNERKLKLGSQVIHAGQRPEEVTGAMVPPIVTASTYAQASPGQHTGFEYTRSHNPTRYALERMVALLEGTEVTEAEDPSCGGFAFASGMAAMATVLELLDRGGTIVSMDDLYGGSRRLFSRVRERTQGLEVRYADLADNEAFAAAMDSGVDMVWVETPTNPMMKLADLSAIARIARERSPEALLVCDNTFPSPTSQRPFEHGFDIVLHSTTKYLNGHSDSIGGVLVAREAAMAEELRFLQNAIGAVMSPFDAYLTLRGIKTLELRMQRHAKNARRIAERLEAHGAVERVLYPGLPSHPQHELCRRQMADGGGMISFYIRGDLETAKRFLEVVEVFQLAESLGAVESLVNHPALMTHASVTPEVREELGITDTLIRLSVGIEDPDDLVAALEDALAVAVPSAASLG